MVVRVKGRLGLVVDLRRSEIVLVVRDREGVFVGGVAMDAGMAECLVEHLLFVLGRFFTDGSVGVEVPSCRGISLKVVK